MVKLPLNILQLIMWILPLTLLQIHGNMFLVAKVQELEVSKDLGPPHVLCQVSFGF